MKAIDFFESKIQSTISPMDYLHASKAAPDDFVLIDVRNAPDHIKKDKIKGALDIGQNVIMSRLSDLPKDKLIVVYCWETWCNLGAKAAIDLINSGYKVKEFGGGIAAWKALGLETESIV